jgi:hypothetical protein
MMRFLCPYQPLAIACACTLCPSSHTCTAARPPLVMLLNWAASSMLQIWRIWGHSCRARHRGGGRQDETVMRSWGLEREKTVMRDRDKGSDEVTSTLVRCTTSVVNNARDANKVLHSSARVRAHRPGLD